jgi:hypothetical protein
LVLLTFILRLVFVSHSPIHLFLDRNTRSSGIIKTIFHLSSHGPRGSRARIITSRNKNRIARRKPMPNLMVEPPIASSAEILHPTPLIHRRAIIKTIHTISMLIPSDAPARTNPSSALIYLTSLSNFEVRVVIPLLFTLY